MGDIKNEINLQNYMNKIRLPDLKKGKSYRLRAILIDSDGNFSENNVLETEFKPCTTAGKKHLI